MIKTVLSKWQGKIVLAMLGTVGFSTSASAINFYNTYQETTDPWAPSFTQEQIAGIELATGILSEYLQDDIDIHVHYKLSYMELPSSIAGEATPKFKKMNYDMVKLGLQNDASNGGYNLYLPDSPQGNNYYSRKLTNGTYDHESYEILTTFANNKAIGNDVNPNDNSLELYVLLNGYANWNYDHDNNINNNEYDFVGVVLHELGHGLGNASGLDFIGDNVDENNGKNLATPWDLFRYTQDTANYDPQNPDRRAINFALGEDSYFSIDGGENPFSVVLDADYSNGHNHSPSHWKKLDDDYIGVMAPSIRKGELLDISENDLMSFDYMGYSVNHNAIIDLNQLKIEAEARANTATIVDRHTEVQELLDYNHSLKLPYSGWWINGEGGGDTKTNVLTTSSKSTNTELTRDYMRISTFTYSLTAEPSQSTAQSVPEPNATKGFLAFVGAIGLFQLFKSGRAKK